MGALMKKLEACVGVWSHSAVNNDKLKDIHGQLEEDFHEIYELIRRTVARCDCIFYKKLKNVSCEYDRLNG